MSTDAEGEYVAALIELHRGLDRQGPGDANFALDLLRILPGLPARPRIADLGCGSGAGALLLTAHFRSQVKAVDSATVFIAELEARAKRAGLEHLITPVLADMGRLDWPAASIDLLWSEGAAYNLGFERALCVWRPLLADSGIAVVSELSWFLDDVPEPPRAFWHAAYPGMGSEAENIRRAVRAGFDVLATRRLPTRLWWTNYYDPLRERIERLQALPASRAVIHDTEQEMALFEQFSDSYGYAFYVLRAT